MAQERTSILVVDDSAICREPVAAALEANGYATVCAENGRDALASLRQHIPDLILLDISMPEMDGLAVLDVVRNNPAWRQIPVILLTDRAERELVLQAGRGRANAFLLKSRFSLHELLSRVKTCLQSASSMDHRTPAPVPACDSATSGAKSVRGDEARSAPQQGATCASPGATRRQSNDGRTGVPSETARMGSAADLAPIITRENLITLINNGLELRPLGPTVHNVFAVTANSSCSADDVYRAVAPDQALCVRLLKLANSSAYSRGRPVEGVKESIQRIGVQGVRDLAAAIDILQKYDDAASKYLDVRTFWEHSIACGVIASAIARARQSRQADKFFLWGLIHDVGRLIMLEHVPEKYCQVWETARALALPLESVEAKMMLMDHCSILARALEHWKFPVEFITPVTSHHQSIRGIQRLGPRHSEAAAIIALADRLAHALVLGSSGNDVLYPLGDVADYLGLLEADLSRIVETAPDEVNEVKLSILARSGQEPWPDHAAQVRNELSVAIINPICVSSAPSVDVLGLFCSRVFRSPIEQAQHVGIVHLRSPAELPELGSRMQAAESERGIQGVPVVLICDKGSPVTEVAWLRNRRFAVLRTPLRIAAFLDSVRSLLS